ncbi:hypothetical protein E4U54_000978 [Claviceps lovelessii]|nr:hypothetical protein E4U54_000978 [Claviceps lovelessii]
MARSLSIRRRGMAKAAPSPPARRQSDELSLRAIPYTSTTRSDPPFQLVPVKTAVSPSRPCSSPPSPTKPISTTSSIYPDSTHSTVVPDSPHSSILSPFPARDDPKDPSSVMSGGGGGGKRSSAYAAAQIWEDIYDASATIFVAEPENQLPAYLAPHIIYSERDEDQPAELFAAPSTPPLSSSPSLPPAQQALTGRGSHAAAWPTPENSKCAEAQSMLRTLKKKSRFWGTLRLGKRQSIAIPENEPPPPLSSPPYEHTRGVRLGSNADTVTTEDSVVTPADEVCPWETSHAPSDRSGFGKDQLEDGTGILEAHGVHQELLHTIAVDIPRDSRFGDEFWAKFPRCFI